MEFRDREEAGRLLAERMAALRGHDPLVLAIPRGAVVMGREIAAGLEGELDVVLVRKLGAPGQPELAIGAIDEEGGLYLDENAALLGVGREYIQRESEAQLDRLQARRRRYTPTRPPIPAAGRIAVVVDDGVATGASMIVALRSVRRQGPARLLAATAVMPRSTLPRIEEMADEVVCLAFPPRFRAVGEFFADFSQVSDEEVEEILRAGARPGAGA